MNPQRRFPASVSATATATARRGRSSPLWAALPLVTLAAPPPALTAEPYPAEAVAPLEATVREEMSAWGIGGIAVALVDGGETVYAEGFGEAGRDSVFRVGSISKLFNAIAVMQQVEAGRLDLDAPVRPDLLPANPFPGKPAVTLRQLLSHRSGLQRESRVGSYLDNSEPGIAATVASLRGGVLATRPGEKTRYSNIAPTLAGHLVERASGLAYPGYQRKRILGPLKMENSWWLRADLPAGRLVVSHMRVADGDWGWRRQRTPVFDLGTVPAGNLFSTAGDLARFAAALLAGGGGVVRPETLAEMWKPQLTEADSGFGLGFHVGKFRGHRAISHSGAVYGHSTALMVLPEAGVGAVVLTNEDIASGRVARVRTAALDVLLQRKHGEVPPGPPAPVEVDPADLAAYAGDYESQSYWARLEVRDGQLHGDLSGQPTEFSPQGEDRFATESRIYSGGTAIFRRDAGSGAITGFSHGSQHYRRAPEAPDPLPEPWRAYLGSYGHDFIPLIVTERHGHLYVMTENMVDYRLTPVNQNTFLLPPGMYVDEHAIFLTDRDGRAARINFCNMFFDRRE